MGSGNLKISHNFTGETGFVIAVWRKATVPLTEVGRQPYPAPHSQQSLLILGLDPVWYTIKFYRSVDGVALDSEILTLAGNAATGAVFGMIRYMYVVDRGYDNTTPPGTGTEVWHDPTSTTDILRDERLKDKIYFIEIRGTGSLGTDEYNDRSDLGGGFDILTGLTWEAEQRIFVWVAVPIDLPSGGGSSGGEVTDVVVITTDTTFDPLIHGGKLIVVEFTAAIARLDLPNLASLPDTFFKIQTHGSTKQCGVQLDIGDTVKVRGENLNVVWFGIGEEGTFLIRENVMYAIKIPDGYNTLGQRVWGDMLELNSVFRDGTQYNQTDQPRLMQFIDRLPSSFVVAEGTGAGQWGFSQVINGETVFPNKGKFARVDTGTPKIRVPDSRNRAQRALSSIVADNVDAENITNNPGGYQHMKTSMKGVIIGIRDGSGGSSTGTIQGTGFSGQDNYNVWFHDNQHIRFNDPADGFTGFDENRASAERLLPLLKI